MTRTVFFNLNSICVIRDFHGERSRLEFKQLLEGFKWRIQGASESRVRLLFLKNFHPFGQPRADTVWIVLLDKMNSFADDLTGIGVTAMRGASGIQFRCSPPGHFIDWHPAPARQYVVILQGQSKITVGDGSSHTFGTGDVLFADDLTGRGHTTEAVSDEPRVSIFVPLTD